MQRLPKELSCMCLRMENDVKPEGNSTLPSSIAKITRKGDGCKFAPISTRQAVCQVKSIMYLNPLEIYLIENIETEEIVRDADGNIAYTLKGFGWEGKKGWRDIADVILLLPLQYDKMAKDLLMLIKRAVKETLTNNAISHQN